MKHFLLLIVLCCTCVFAQDFNGTYQVAGETLTLQQQGSALEGQISSYGFTFTLTGHVEGNQAFATVAMSDYLAFDVELTLQGANELLVKMIHPDPSLAGSYVYTRVTGNPLASAPAVTPLNLSQTSTQPNAAGSTSRQQTNTQETGIRLLGGLELTGEGGSSSGNSDNDAFATSVKEEFYLFCSDGSYAYKMTKTSMFSSEFGSFSSEDGDYHDGWYEVSNDQLVLQASDGREFVLPIQESSSGFVIDGAEFSAAQSSYCQ